MTWWAKESFPEDFLHSFLRLFSLLPIFCFSASERMRDYYLSTWYLRIASRVVKRLKTSDLRKLGNIRKLSKLQLMLP